MLEIYPNTARFWTQRHSTETRLRLAYGQTHREIAAALGMSYHTVRDHVRKEGLKPAVTLGDRLSLALALEADKTIVDALSADPGSAGQARLRTGLRLLARELLTGAPPDAAPDDDPDRKEGEMRSLKEIREMSVDELRAYVASLVPGLEGKSDDPADAGPTGTDGEISVSADSETRSETSTPGDGMA